VTRKNLLIVAIALGSMLGGVALYHMLQTRLFTGPAATSQAPFEIHSIPLTDLDQRETVLADWQAEVLVYVYWALLSTAKPRSGASPKNTASITRCFWQPAARRCTTPLWEIPAAACHIP
jgi:hypothetical protein